MSESLDSIHNKNTVILDHIGNNNDDLMTNISLRQSSQRSDKCDVRMQS